MFKRKWLKWPFGKTPSGRGRGGASSARAHASTTSPLCFHFNDTHSRHCSSNAFHTLAAFMSPFRKMREVVAAGAFQKDTNRPFSCALFLFFLSSIIRQTISRPTPRRQHQSLPPVETHIRSVYLSLPELALSRQTPLPHGCSPHSVSLSLSLMALHCFVQFSSGFCSSVLSRQSNSGNIHCSTALSGCRMQTYRARARTGGAMLRAQEEEMREKGQRQNGGWRACCRLQSSETVHHSAKGWRL